MAAAFAALDSPSAKEAREQILAFVTDQESYEVVDQVVTEMLLPQAGIRKGDVKAAIGHLADARSPRLLIVDLAGSEMPLSEVNALADVCEPGVAVIALGNHNDCGIFRDLIQHGVADYLVKPISPQLLQRSIAGLSETGGPTKAQARLGKLVGVVGARGGVGSTMVSTNLAWLVASERRRRTVLVDLDLQFGTVALSLDLEPSSGLREALENPNRIDGLMVERVLVPHSDRLFVLSAEESPDETVLLDYNAIDLLLTELRNKFHYVIVDLPRSAGPVTHQVLQACNELILVSDLSLAGMRDTMRLSSLIPTVNASCRISLVANRMGEHKVGSMPRAEFEKGINRKIDFVLPFDNKTVAAAMNFGQPVAASKGAVAAGLRSIAHRLCGPIAGEGGGRSRTWLKLLAKG